MVSLQYFAQRGGKVSRVSFERIETPYGPYRRVIEVAGHIGVNRRPVLVDTSSVFKGCEAWPEDKITGQLIEWGRRHKVYVLGLGLLNMSLWEVQ